MSKPSTDAYLHAVRLLDSISRDAIDVEDRLAEIDLETICDYPRTGNPAQMRDGGKIDVWELRELQRWYVETLMQQVRRRAAVMKRVADRA